MPTSSQWQILKHVVKSETPVQEDIANKLQALEEDEEDLFGLQKLKTQLENARAREIQSAGQKRGQQTTPIGRPLSGAGVRPVPALPRRMKSKLFGLGFRSSDNMKKQLPQNEIEDDSQQEYADGIIKELLNHHNAYMTPKKIMKDPDLKPKAVCFNYPGSDLTHLEVKRAMDKLLVPYPEIKMTTIEFQPRYKLLRPDRMDNTCRWVISFNTEWGRCRMTNREFKIKDEVVTTKRYDETVVLEYKQFGRMTEIMKIVKNTEV